MSSPTDIDGWSIAAFTLSVLGLLSSAASPVALSFATVDTTTVEEATFAVVVAVVTLLTLPLLSISFARKGAAAIRRAAGTLTGRGFGHAAEILSIISIFNIVAFVALLAVGAANAEDEASALDDSATPAEVVEPSRSTATFTSFGDELYFDVPLAGGEPIKFESAGPLAVYIFEEPDSSDGGSAGREPSISCATACSGTYVQQQGGTFTVEVDADDEWALTLTGG